MPTYYAGLRLERADVGQSADHGQPFVQIERHAGSLVCVANVMS